MAPSSSRVVSDDEGAVKMSAKKDRPSKSNGIIKLKKTPPKNSKDPGTWRDGSLNADDKKKNGDNSSLSPVVNQLDDIVRETFATGRPLEDSSDNLTCKHCKKTFTKIVAAKHVRDCIKAQKEKLQKRKLAKEARDRARKEEQRGDKDDDGDTRMDSGDDDDDASPEKKAGGLKSMKKTGGKKVDIDDATKKGKKRKADGDAEKGPKMKKKKEELKPKAPKPKGPVDVERQCGVLVKEGVQCARSLTCKSHSMGAKRAVAGRSLPYDMLLSAYQKKNQAKQQKAAIDASAPLEDEDAGLGPIDSDEELTAVMQGLSNWNPQPVVPPLVPIRVEREYQKKRLYEQLHNATNGFTINICAVAGLGAQKPPPPPPEDMADGEEGSGGGLGQGMLAVASRRASAFHMALPPRRASGLVGK